MIAAALPALIVVAQTAPADSIGPRLQALADSVIAVRPSLPGVLIYVESAGLSRTWSMASGWSDTARTVALDPAQPLRIASNTKTYVAAAILRLMERGKLVLRDPISRHLPPELTELLETDGYRTDSITIEHVLSHRSGLDEHASVPSYIRVALRNPAKRWTRLEQVRWLVDSLAPIGPPGGQFKYSDTGYILLGAIVERYTGRNLGAGVRELLDFERLGLRHTWFETLEPEPPGLKGRVHQYINGLDTFGHDPSLDLYGGGGIAASLADLGAFLTALVGGHVFERPATLDTMLAPRSPQLGGYGLGIYRMGPGGRLGFGHSGFWGTQAAHFPEDGLTIAVAVTEQSQGGAIPGIVNAIMRALFPVGP